jgi:hypothetical protein
MNFFLRAVPEERREVISRVPGNGDPAGITDQYAIPLKGRAFLEWITPAGKQYQAEPIVHGRQSDYPGAG